MGHFSKHGDLLTRISGQLIPAWVLRQIAFLNPCFAINPLEPINAKQGIKTHLCMVYRLGYHSVGTSGDTGNLRKDFPRALEKAGLAKIRFHDLRHTAASIMLNRGVPPIVVSRRLGHANPSTTLNVYAHLYMESQDEPARIMDEILTPVLVSIPKAQEVERRNPDVK